MQVRWYALLALVHTSIGSVSPVATLSTLSSVAATSAVGGLNETPSKNATARDGRRRSKRKKSRSTSSSSGERLIFSRSADESGNSLGIEDSDSSSSDEKTTRWSTIAGEGWRKWHRTCAPCPDEMVKKWRDPTIKWICGGYQRARRSFKSECMMYYRNCQDGTMFVKLHDHRCDDRVPGWNHGRHFFYDYPVRLLDESSDSQDISESESDTSGTSDVSYDASSDV